MNLKHTPGEWEVKLFHGLPFIVSKLTGLEIASPYFQCGLGELVKSPEKIEEVAANSRLIAAAPEMLETLIKLIPVINEHLFDACADHQEGNHLAPIHIFSDVLSIIERVTGMSIEEIIK